MSLSEPSDFVNDPYSRGLNQMGHSLLGAMFLGVLLPFVSLTVAAICVAIFSFVWEYLQLKGKGATKKDYMEDLFFWFSGIGYGHYIYEVYELPFWLLLPFILSFYIPYRLGGGRIW